MLNFQLCNKCAKKTVCKIYAHLDKTLKTRDGDFNTVPLSVNQTHCREFLDGGK